MNNLQPEFNLDNAAWVGKNTVELLVYLRQFNISPDRLALSLENSMCLVFERIAYSSKNHYLDIEIFDTKEILMCVSDPDKDLFILDVLPGDWSIVKDHLVGWVKDKEKHLSRYMKNV